MGGAIMLRILLISIWLGVSSAAADGIYFTSAKERKIADEFQNYSMQKLPVMQDTLHDIGPHAHRNYGKTVWILWLQGWSTAPALCQEVAQNWIRLNPTWNVELISAATLHHNVHIPYIHNPDMSAAVKSDIIRISLLAKHGGAWADASLMCWAPLDDWVYEALRPTGYFMFQFSLWFHVNVKQSIPMQRWKRATDEYWTDVIANKLRVKEYAWMSFLMNDGLRRQKDVSESWQAMPFLDCCNGWAQDREKHVQSAPN